MAYSKQFGELNLFQSVRIQAQINEIDGYYPAAVEEWETALKILEQENNPQDNLKIALMCRHCVELLTREDKSFYKNWEVELLEKSLTYDPKDRDTYFKLMERTKGNLSKHYRIINRAIEKFPNDTEVLFKGIKAALDRGAMKKASRLAAKLPRSLIHGAAHCGRPLQLTCQCPSRKSNTPICMSKITPISGSLIGCVPDAIL